MNLKRQFYREYYNGFDYRALVTANAEQEERNVEALEAANQLLYDYRPPQTVLTQAALSAEYFPEADGFFRLALQTTYPGLVSGTGYRHETKTEKEIKIGFHFDHTTGLPVLPGSGVKGVLRSAFPRRNQPKTSEAEEIKQAKAIFILKLVRHYGVEVAEDDYGFVRQLEADIFGDVVGTGTKMGRDVFLDATPTTANPQGKIIGPDVLTPHGEDLLKNPTPLPFLKVLPEVTFTFCWKLKDFVEGEEVRVTAQQKHRLLRAILLLFGVGAKTNVGYGQLIDPRVDTEEWEWLEAQDVPEEVEALPAPRKINDPVQNEVAKVVNQTTSSWSISDVKPAQRNQLKRGRSIWGKVLSVTGQNILLELHLENMKAKDVKTATLKFTLPDKPSVGKWGECIVKNIQGGKKAISEIALEVNKFKLENNS